MKNETANASATAGDAAQVAALVARAAALMAQDYSQARAVAQEAVRLAERTGDLAARAASGRMLGRCCCYLQQHDEALACLEDALALSRRCGATATEGHCLHDIGMVFFFRADYLSAIRFLLQALDIGRRGGDRATLDSTLSNLGVCYHEMGDYETALRYGLESLDICQEMGDAGAVAASLNNIGCIYEEQGDYAQALDCCTRAAALSRDASRVMYAYSLCNVGNLYHRLGRCAEAQETGTQALALAREAGDAALEVGVLKNLGESSVGLADTRRAHALYTEALGVARAGALRHRECEILLCLGRLSRDAGEWERAEEHLTGALRLGEALQAKRPVSEAHQALAETCKRRGDYAAALHHHETFYTLEKQILSDQTAKQTQALRGRLEIEKAQHALEKAQSEAELHRLRSVELAQLNEALRLADEAREALLEEVRAQSEELARQAAEDGLTGLHNRRSLEEWLARAFARARRGDSPLTVALLDIDHFKGINDRFGHETGDSVLREFARLLRAVCRPGDLAARYGGEEFVLALPGADTVQGRAVCERVRAAVESHPWHTLHPALCLTVSIGFSNDTALDSHERQLAQADAHLYRAKHGGRNRVCG